MDTPNIPAYLLKVSWGNRKEPKTQSDRAQSAPYPFPFHCQTCIRSDALRTTNFLKQVRLPSRSCHDLGLTWWNSQAIPAHLAGPSMPRVHVRVKASLEVDVTWVQNRPTRAQGRLNMGPRWPNIGPSWANMGPRWANIGPRWPNIDPNWAQDRPT